MAIEFRVAALAKQKGITGYAINKKINAKHPYEGYRLLKVDGQESLSKETIARICVALECQPGDFIVLTPDEKPAGKKSAGKTKPPKK